MTISADLVLTLEEHNRINVLKDGARKKEVERKVEKSLADEKNAGIDYYAIAQEILRKGDFISFNNAVFRYADGVFREDKGQLESQIQTILQYRGMGAKEKVTTATAQVKHYILYNAPYEEYPFNQSPNAIPIDNGVLMLDFETGALTLVPHSPKFRFNYKLRVKYDPSANTVPAAEYLDSLGIDRELLLQIPAHSVLSMLGRVYKRAYFLKGDRDSGKSTFIRLVTEYLFGPSVCSNISLHDLLISRFRLAELDGKIVNAYADLADSKIGNLGLFKALTGGDMVTVERKHRDPYHMVNRAVFLFSANRYPKIKGCDDAWWSRWIAIKFTKSFLRDTEYEGTLFTDDFISGFLLLVLQRLTAITKAKELITTDNVERDWLSDASSCYAFIRDCLEPCPGAGAGEKRLVRRLY
jgi:phage/plasmid-associated DNA primase